MNRSLRKLENLKHWTTARDIIWKGAGVSTMPHTWKAGTWQYAISRNLETAATRSGSSTRKSSSLRLSFSFDATIWCAASNFNECTCKHGHCSRLQMSSQGVLPRRSDATILKKRSDESGRSSTIRPNFELRLPCRTLLITLENPTSEMKNFCKGRNFEQNEAKVSEVRFTSKRMVWKRSSRAVGLLDGSKFKQLAMKF